MKYILMIFLLTFSLNANEAYYHNGKLVELQNLHSPRNFKGASIEFYKTQNGQKVGLTDEILLKCKENVNCVELLNKFHIYQYSKLTDKIYAIKTTDNNIFSLSRKLYESGDVIFAHPNFIRERKRR